MRANRDNRGNRGNRGMPPYQHELFLVLIAMAMLYRQHSSLFPVDKRNNNNKHDTHDNHNKMHLPPSALCTPTTDHTFDQVPIRFIVFQRDTSEQLHDLIAYYSHVVSLSSLVIIDHNGVDRRTNDILLKFGSKGMHVWRCLGDWEVKDAMWTHVVRQYANSSEFVFPIDVDEYLAVVDYSAGDDGDDGERTSSSPSLPSLEWSKAKLDRELSILRTNFDGRPFKTTTSTAISPECPGFLDAADNSHYSIHRFHSKTCSVHHVHWEHDPTHDPVSICMSKVLTKGSAYHSTDTGNHYGSYREDPEFDFRGACKAYVARAASQAAIHASHVADPVNTASAPDPYTRTNLTLIHMSDITYLDWLSHAIRGASSYGYNLFGAAARNLNCFQAPGSHYCEMWKELEREKFDYWRTRELFRRTKCPDPPNPNLAEGVNGAEGAERPDVLSTSKVFGAFCSSD